MPTEDEKTQLKEAREASLLEKWASGKRLTEEEREEVAPLLPDTPAATKGAGAEKFNPRKVGKTMLAACLRVNIKTLTVWQQEGMPFVKGKTAVSSNAYDIAEVVKWMILRETRGGLDLETERAKLAKEQQETARLKNLRLSGRAIDLEAACSVAQRAAFAIRQRILGLTLPEAEKRQLLADLHALAETEFDGAEAKLDEELEDEPDTPDEPAAGG